MDEGTPIQDHVLKMISHLNELEILGAEIDGETQVDIVLKLPIGGIIERAPSS